LPLSKRCRTTSEVAHIYTHVWFRETRDGTVAVVNSYSRRQPTWVRYRDKDLGQDVEEFWIRMGNSNERLAANAAHNSIKKHWAE
jgi:hypothetical protein